MDEATQVDEGAPPTPPASLVPVDHDPFNSLVLVDHDPFALGPVAKPGQVIAPDNPIGAYNAARLQLSHALFPGLTDYLTKTPPPPSMAANAQGKVPPTDNPYAVPALLDVGAMLGPLAAEKLAGQAGLAAARGAEALAPDALAGLPARLAPQAPLQSEAGELANSLANKSAGLYDFPNKPQRPFSADYPQVPATDAAGRLKVDIEGRPLVAPTIVGRRVLGGADEALTPAESNAVGTAGTGRRPKSFPPGPARGFSAGVLEGYVDPQGQPQLRILVNPRLSPDQRAMTVAHETGHAIDHLAGVPIPGDPFWNGIPQSGLRRELNRVYSAGSTGVDQTGNLVLPREFGYRGSEVAPELMAEAIRAYMANPNYLKTVAPGTAAAIRAAVNSNPMLSRIIQFNTIAAAAGAGAGGSGDQLVPVDHDPYQQ